MKKILKIIPFGESGSEMYCLLQISPPLPLAGRNTATGRTTGRWVPPRSQGGAGVCPSEPSQALSHLSHLTSERKACPYLISCHSSERHDAQPQLTSDIKMFSHGAPAVRWQQLAFFFIKLIDSLAFYHLLSLFIICSLLATYSWQINLFVL